jgi:hypothetical protein
MAKNRTAFEKIIIDTIDEMMPGSDMVNIYKQMFASMSDSQLDEYVQELKTEKANLFIIAPNLTNAPLEVSRNIDIAKSRFNYDFWQNLYTPDNDGVSGYLTPNRYICMYLPVRRQAQMLQKKISVSDTIHSIDNFTGTASSKGKTSRMSFPEIQILASKGLDETTAELISVRGGDQGAFKAFNTSIERTGGVSLKAIVPYSTGVRSKHSLKVYLTGAHLKNTL